MATLTPADQTSWADVLALTAESLRRSTVHVRVGRHGGGSGVIWTADGVIVTNAHVARAPAATVELWDGRTFDAAVTSRDARRDLAALRIEAAELPAAVIADSNSLRVGELAVAVGNPLGLTGALTLGIIHAIAPSEGHGHQTWVQADVHLAPGNSGGPLADGLGRVIGINSMTAGNLGLAVPSADVLRFLASESRPRLGITTQPVTVAATASETRQGLLVLEVQHGSPADVAGLALGDILVGADGQVFAGPRDLLQALSRSDQHGGLVLDILRGGFPRSVHVFLRSGGVVEGAGVAA